MNSIIRLAGLALSGILAIAPTVFSQENTLSEEFRTILEGARMGDEIVYSGKGRLVYEMVNTDSASVSEVKRQSEAAKNAPLGKEYYSINSRRMEIKYAFSSPKIFTKEKYFLIGAPGEYFHIDEEAAFDGENTYSIMEELTPTKIARKSGAIRPENKIKDNQYAPQRFGMSIYGAPVASFLLGALKFPNMEEKLESVVLIGEEIQDNVHCIKFRGTFPEKTDTLTVWLAPERMYRPVRIEWVQAETRTEVRTSFREHRGNIWFPRSIQCNTYTMNKETGSMILHFRNVITVLDDFEINIPLSDQDFTLHFPKGLRVTDYRTHETILIE